MGNVITLSAVSDKQSIETVVSLAAKIWNATFPPIIGKSQTDYMLKRFQSEEAIALQIEKEGELYYLLNCGNDCVGYMSLIPKPASEELHISKFYIIPTEQHKGYGRQALGLIEKFAREKKLKKLVLNVNKSNKSAIDAYKKYGFFVLGSVVVDIGKGFVMDDHKMTKMVSPK